MEESKLSMRQKTKFNYFLRNGEPLPSLGNAPTRRNPNLPEIKIRPGSSKRRQRDAILRSGAYEREKFRPIHPKVNREREKERLQNIMAFNKDILVTGAGRIKDRGDRKDEPELNRFDQLVQEIQDREEWLNEMEELGQGDRYRTIIEHQIQAKVREMNNLKCPRKK